LAKLVIENGPGKGRELRLARGVTVTCGRDSMVDLPLPDSLASRKHFTIETRNGDLYLVDLDSSNGTFINGRRIKEKMLRLGDSIQVGETLISVLEDSERADAGGLLGQVVAGYRLEKRVGRGGMGTVYKAMQLSLDRPVALKILSDELADNREFTSMFIREARAAARLSHPNIVLAYDVGKDKDKFFFAMEYVPGGSVQDLLAREKKLPLDKAVHFIIEAARALEYAERQGVVHRDIKPDNLMITQDGGIKICDLGLARNILAVEPSTSAEGICGSPHYIAPEQAQGKPVDHRADIYSLGATFYRMLAGTTPFSGSNIKELIKKHITENPRPIRELEPSTPESVARVIERMMAKDPAKRYQSASQVISDLTSLQALRYAVELEPEPAAPVIEIPEEITGATEGKDEDAPLVLEEDPIKLEEALPHAPIIPPLEAPRPPRAPFPWRKTWRIAAATLGVLVLLGCIMAIVVVIHDRGYPDKAWFLHLGEERWVKEISDAQKLSYKDMKAAVEQVRKIQKDYPKSNEAQEKTKESLKEFKARLLAAGTAEAYNLVLELYPDDAAAVAKANAGLDEIAKRNALYAAEKDLSDMENDAQAFEQKNYGNRLQMASEIMAKFQAVLAKKQETYSQFSSRDIDGTLGKAREKIDYYNSVISGMPEFNAAVQTIRSAIQNKQYAQARSQMEALKTKFPAIIDLGGLPGDIGLIEAAAGQEYSEIKRAVQVKLRESKYDPAAKTYNNFKDIYALFDDFKARYGEGSLLNDINALTGQMQQLLQFRNEAQDLIAQEKYQEAAETMKAKLAAITHPDLAELAKRALQDIENAQLDTQSRKNVEAFNNLKQEVEGLLDKLRTGAAQQKLSDFKNVIEQTRADYQALSDEVAAQRDFLQAVVRSVATALGADKKIILPSYGKLVTSLDMESVRMEGVAAPVTWAELSDKADLSVLLEFAAGNLQTDSERLGAATVCLNHGKSLAAYKMGYEAMTGLAQTSASRYGDMLKQYAPRLQENLTALVNALKTEYFSEGVTKARQDELAKQILAIQQFQNELPQPPQPAPAPTPAPAPAPTGPQG